MQSNPYDKEYLKRRLIRKRNIIADDHWIWTGCIGKRGHGRSVVNRRSILVSRLSMHVFMNFNLNSKLQVNHKCLIPACFNPDHLYVGTQADNRRDEMIKETSINQHTNQTHCQNGHELSGDNLIVTYANGSRHRRCRICINKAQLERLRRKRNASYSSR